MLASQIEYMYELLFRKQRYLKKKNKLLYVHLQSFFYIYS